LEDVGSNPTATITLLSRGGILKVEVELDFDTCITCGVVYAVPKTFTSARKTTKASFYCPNGHAMHYQGDSPEKMREKITNLENQVKDLEKQLKESKDENLQLRMKVDQLEAAAMDGGGSSGQG